MTTDTITTTDHTVQSPPTGASTRVILVAIIAIAVAGIAIVGLVRSDDVAAAHIAELEYDIAEDGTRFVFDDAPPSTTS